VLQAHFDLLIALAAEWRIADLEAVRLQKNDLLPIIRACIQEQLAVEGGVAKSKCVAALWPGVLGGAGVK